MKLQLNIDSNARNDKDKGPMYPVRGSNIPRDISPEFQSAELGVRQTTAFKGNIKITDRRKCNHIL